MPLLMGALGGLYSERSGVTNLCIEGLMLFGCFSSAAVIVKLQAIPGFSYTLALVIGIIAAMAASALLSLLHAFASINLKSNQVISGTAINMLSTAVSLFLAQTITGSGNITIVRGVITAFVLKDVLDDVDMPFAMAFLLVPAIPDVVRTAAQSLR